MYLILTRDNGRIDQLLTDLPGLQVIVLDTGKDRFDDDQPLTTLPNGETALVESMDVEVDAVATAALLRAVDLPLEQAPVFAPVLSAPARMLVVWLGFDTPFVFTEQGGAYADQSPPDREMVQHLANGGYVEVIKLSPKCHERDLLAEQLTDVLRRNASLWTLGDIRAVVTYHTLDDYFAR